MNKTRFPCGVKCIRWGHPKFQKVSGCGWHHATEKEQLGEVKHAKVTFDGMAPIYYESCVADGSRQGWTVSAYSHLPTNDENRIRLMPVAAAFFSGDEFDGMYVKWDHYQFPMACGIWKKGEPYYGWFELDVSGNIVRSIQTPMSDGSTLAWFKDGEYFKGTTGPLGKELLDSNEALRQGFVDCYHCFRELEHLSLVRD